MRFRAVQLKPYEFNFAIIKSCGRQSSPLERFVRRAPNTFPLSTAFFHFSVIAKRQCWALYPFCKCTLVFREVLILTMKLLHLHIHVRHIEQPKSISEILYVIFKLTYAHTDLLNFYVTT